MTLRRRSALIEWRQRRQEQREANFAALAATKGRAAVYGGETVADPKPEPPVRHEGYRRLVALFPCKGCGIGFLSQAAHPNTGKGAGTKTDDRECFPLCADSPGRQGCHPKFDQGALFDKATRRLLEPAWGADTRRQIKAAGMWPADLADWPEEN